MNHRGGSWGSKKKPKGPRPTDHPQKILGNSGLRCRQHDYAFKLDGKGCPKCEATFELVPEMLAVLKEVEWNMEFDGELCPECKADKRGSEIQDRGHYPDCKLAAIITKAEAVLA